MASNSKLIHLRDKFMQDFYYQKNNNEAGADPSSLSSVILKECVVCMSGVADGVLMPCGHSGICYECAIQMLQKEE
jgi:Zinc finger, C3HC4 type (RING finger)